MSGTVSTNFAANWRNPAIVIGDTPAANNSLPAGKPTLILAQGAGGNATGGQAYLAVNLSNVQALFGNTSMATAMYRKYLLNDPTATVYIGAVAISGGTSQVQTITVTGPATGNGTLALYLAGNYTPVAVTSGQTATQIASNIVTAIALTTTPVTATATAGVVTVTTNQAGAAAGDIQISVNYYGAANGEVLPAGVGITVAQTTAGAGVPSNLNTLFSNLGSLDFDYIVNPYTDSASTAAVTTFLSQSGEGRWNPYVQLYGQSFSAVRNSVSGLVTFGDALNDQFQSFLGFQNAPEPAYLWTSAYGSYAASCLRNNPSKFIVGGPLNVMPPTGNIGFASADQNTLLFNGISTYNVVNGQVVMGRAVTSYQVNPATDIPDTSWLNVTTPAQLAFVNRTVVSQLDIYIGGVIVSNGTPVNNLNNYITPNEILATASGVVNQLIAAGVLQSNPNFTSQASCTYVGNNSVILFLPIILATELYSIGVNVSFTANS